jgi:iron complex transport system substrate-binding protein
MGKISGNEKRAAEVKGIMEKYVAKVTNVTSKIPENERPTVYWMWSNILGTAGVESGINDVIDQAGGVNVLESWDNSTKSMEHPTLTLEALIKLNPDVIYMWYNENLDPKDIMTGEDFKGWKDINAIKSGRVYEIENPYLFDAFSPRLPLSLMHVAKDLHSEKLKDLNMTQEIDQFHVEMYGFHYPSMMPA